MSGQGWQLRGLLRRGDFTLDIDLDLPPGQVAVVGPNGAGKSSLLRLIAGLEALEADHVGELVIGGSVLDAPLSGVFVPAEQRDIAMAFQSPRLFPHLKVIDNVAYPLRRAGTQAAETRIQVRGLLTELGVAHLAERRPDKLSVGEAQRVGIARALAQNATTVLLDEPLAAIDEDGRDELREKLKKLEAPRLVWVTHSPEEASDASVVVSVADGTARRVR